MTNVISIIKLKKTTSVDTKFNFSGIRIKSKNINIKKNVIILKNMRWLKIFSGGNISVQNIWKNLEKFIKFIRIMPNKFKHPHALLMLL